MPRQCPTSGLEHLSQQHDTPPALSNVSSTYDPPSVACGLSLAASLQTTSAVGLEHKRDGT